MCRYPNPQHVLQIYNLPISVNLDFTLSNRCLGCAGKTRERCDAACWETGGHKNVTHLIVTLDLLTQRKRDVCGGARDWPTANHAETQFQTGFERDARCSRDKGGQTAQEACSQCGLPLPVAQKSDRQTTRRRRHRANGLISLGVRRHGRSRDIDLATSEAAWSVMPHRSR